MLTGHDVFCSVDIAGHRNNVGITSVGGTGVGGLNVWRNSLPAEQMPCGEVVVLDGVPFEFPTAGSGEPDNVRGDGQLLELPAGYYDWVHLLACGERRVEDELALYFTDGSIDFEHVRVSDFWAAEPVFGETSALRSTVMHYPQHVQPRVPGIIWAQRVPVPRRAELKAVRLPRNVALHVFALTAQRATGAWS